MDFLKTIKAPSLLDSSYGDNLEEQFKNIDSNFNTLANRSFVKGDDAPDIKTYIIDLNPVQTASGVESVGNTWKEVFNIIKQKISNTFREKLTTQFDQLKFSNLVLYYKELEIPSTIDDNFIQQITLGFSTVYIYDTYYYGLNTYNEETKNCTGLYQIVPAVYEKGKYIYNISIIENFPQLIFKDNIWLWKITDKKFISAQGEKGDPGTDAVTYMVTVDNEDQISHINGVAIKEIKTEDYYKYNNQACFVIASEKQADIKIALIEVRNGEFGLSNISSITSTFTVDNFIGCMNDEDMPGLFIPTARTNNTVTGTEFSGYILKNNEEHLQISYGELTKSKGSWKFSNQSLGNIYIDNNIHISGEIKPRNRDLILIDGGAKINNSLEVTEDTYLNSLNVSGDSNLNKLTVTGNSNLNSLKVSGDSNLNTLYISGEITPKTQSSVIVDGGMEVRGELNVNQDLNTAGGIYIQGKQWDQIYTFNKTIIGQNMTLATGGSSVQNLVYWNWDFQKKCGWVKLTITPRITLDGTEQPRTRDWRINNINSNGHYILQNIQIGQLSSAAFTSYDFDLFKPTDELNKEVMLGQYNNFISGYDEKNDGLTYKLTYTGGRFIISISRGRIYTVDGGKIMHSDYSEVGYTPYMEFIYPSR